MKGFILIASIILVSLSGTAQTKKGAFKVHIGPEFTTGLFAEGYSTGLGFYITYYYKVTKGGAIVGSAGYATWNVKEGVGTGSAAMLLPRFGYRQFITHGLYAQGDAGIGIGQKNFNGTSSFVMDGGFGYLFAPEKRTSFDVSAKVNRGFNRTWIGLGVGVQF